MTLFWENKTAELSPLGRGPLVEWPPLFSSASAALSPGSNGMAPPLCLPSPTLGKWGSVCLLFWMVVCPVCHCQSTETQKEEDWEGGLCCPICPALGFTTTGPTWRVPHPGPIHLHLCLSGNDSLCIGSLRLPRYVSAPLTGARVGLLTRQWREIQDGQCLTSERPTRAPAWPHSPLCLCGLRVNLLKAGAGAHPLLPTVPQIYCHTVTRAVLLRDLLFKCCVLCL